jgi:hypothetical protein
MQMAMARLTLPQPIPEVLSVFAFPKTEKKWYAGSVKAGTAVVLQKGTQSTGITSHGNVRADPGQILILAERITLWHKMIHTILDPLERE